jgi:hypothetical protein
MNREEYNKLFHKVGLNRVAFKAVNDCDKEILALVNAAIAAEHEKFCSDLRGLHDVYSLQSVSAIRAGGNHE